MQSLYETDFYAWTQEQANLLLHHEWSQLDLSNLIEEIESLGKQQRAELRNRLSVLIGHLLKWEYQPERRSRSWLNTIRIQRIDTLELLEENPSLKPYLPSKRFSRKPILKELHWLLEKQIYLLKHFHKKIALTR